MENLIIFVVIIAVIVFCIIELTRQEQKREEEKQELFKSFYDLYNEKTEDELWCELSKINDEYIKITEEAHRMFLHDYPDEDIYTSSGIDRTEKYKESINLVVTIKYQAIVTALNDRAYDDDKWLEGLIKKCKPKAKRKVSSKSTVKTKNKDK